MNRRFARGALLLTAAVALTGCGVPPVTTTERPDGTVVTLDWADYPGHAFIDADDILAAPDVDDVEEHALALMETIRADVAAELGIRLELLSDGGEWSSFESNGYASPSLLTSYSCCALVADVVPAEYADWERLYDIVARASAAAGAGPLVREQDQEGMYDDPDQRAEFDKTWGTGVEGEYSLLFARTTDGGQSVMLTIEDPARRLQASEAEKKVEPRIGIDYSAVVITRGMRTEFEERLAPFAGAAKPDSTEWD